MMPDMSTQPSDDTTGPTTAPRRPRTASCGAVARRSAARSATHAVRPDAAAAAGSGPRARIILALTCLTLALLLGAEVALPGRRLAEQRPVHPVLLHRRARAVLRRGPQRGQGPLRRPPGRVPGLTGYFMGALGPAGARATARSTPTINQGTLVLRHQRARALRARASPPPRCSWRCDDADPGTRRSSRCPRSLLVTATVNWDFLAIGLAAFGLYAVGARRNPALAGRLPRPGCGGETLAAVHPRAAARARPALADGCARGRARRRPRWSPGSSVNFPVCLLYHESWRRFFDLNTERADRLGHVLVRRPLPGRQVERRRAGDQGPFQWLSDHVPPLNCLSYALFGARPAWASSCWPARAAPPRLAQLAFLVVAAFLIISKVWSQQFVLWLLPLIVLARPKWGAFLAWQVAEVGYFVAFYARAARRRRASRSSPRARSCSRPRCGWSRSRSSAAW